MKILVMGNDLPFLSWLASNFTQTKNVVEMVCSIPGALQLATTQFYDVVIAEFGGQKQEGLQLLRHLRKNNNLVPVVIIGAEEELSDVIDCFNAGADDYLCQPFFLEELEARLKALLRRVIGQASTMLSCGSLRYDMNTRRFSSFGVDLSLTPREHDVLEVLIRSQEKTISKREIMDRLCSSEEWISPGAIELRLFRIRKKIAHTGVGIVTFRGQGYMLTTETKSWRSNSGRRIPLSDDRRLYKSIAPATH